MNFKRIEKHQKKETLKAENESEAEERKIKVNETNVS